MGVARFSRASHQAYGFPGQPGFCRLPRSALQPTWKAVISRGIKIARAAGGHLCTLSSPQQPEAEPEARGKESLTPAPSQPQEHTRGPLGLACLSPKDATGTMRVAPMYTLGHQGGLHPQAHRLFCPQNTQNRGHLSAARSSERRLETRTGKERWHGREAGGGTREEALLESGLLPTPRPVTPVPFLPCLRPQWLPSSVPTPGGHYCPSAPCWLARAPDDQTLLMASLEHRQREPQEQKPSPGSRHSPSSLWPSCHHGEGKGLGLPWCRERPHGAAEGSGGGRGWPAS